MNKKWEVLLAVVISVGLYRLCHAGLVSPDNYVDNTVITAEQQNTNLDNICNMINGNLDSSNLAAGAVTDTQIQLNTITEDRFVPVLQSSINWTFNVFYPSFTVLNTSYSLTMQTPFNATQSNATADGALTSSDCAGIINVTGVASQVLIMADASISVAGGGAVTWDVYSSSLALTGCHDVSYYPGSGIWAAQTHMHCLSPIVGPGDETFTIEYTLTGPTGPTGNACNVVLMEMLPQQ